MTSDFQPPHGSRRLLVPLPLDLGPDALRTLNERRHRAFRTRLAEALGLEIVDSEFVVDRLRKNAAEDGEALGELIIALTHPAVFVCYASTGGEPDFVPRQLLSVQPAATHIFFIIPEQTGNAGSGFCDVEEFFTLNFSRPFRHYDSDADLDQVLRLESRDVELDLRFLEAVGPAPAEALKVLLGSPFFTCLFMRVLREALSIARFYAALEAILSSVLAVCQLHEDALEAAGLRCSAPLQLRSRTDFVDGTILSHAAADAAGRSDGVLPFALFGAEPPEDAVRSARALRSLLGMPGGGGLRSWLDVLQFVVEVRNRTKGHGALHQADHQIIDAMCQLAFTFAREWFVGRGDLLLNDGTPLTQGWLGPSSVLATNPLYSLRRRLQFRYPDGTIIPLGRLFVGPQDGPYVFAGTLREGGEALYKNLLIGNYEPAPGEAST